MICISVSCWSVSLRAQEKIVWNLVGLPEQKRVQVFAGGQKFTEFIYPDSLEKPVLYPIYASDGAIVTRGFPLVPRAGEPTDHPHHLGLWLNYENVNGLDFWNNSFAIPADKKHSYGWIKTDKILEVSGGREGHLSYSANWVDQSGNVLIREITQFVFIANAQERIIDRITSIEAQTDISLADAKDGFLGLRVAHELELPSAQPKQYSDNKGNLTTVPANSTVSGNYLTSEGRTGDSAWGTRARWCMMFGKINPDSISIGIIDHPANPGYP
ncbi:MAG: PmoA family protein, partial [Chitinophagales bacterium]